MQIPDKHWLVLTELPGQFRNLKPQTRCELHHAVSWSPIKLVWIGRKLEQTNTLSSECNNLPTLRFFISAASSCLRNSSKWKANESMPTHAFKNVQCFCLFFNFLLLIWAIESPVCTSSRTKMDASTALSVWPPLTSPLLMANPCGPSETCSSESNIQSSMAGPTAELVLL